MKKLSFVIVILLFYHLTAVSQLFVQSSMPTQCSQACLPQGITFSTQEQIDNFQTNYPDCTEIEGDVIIEGDEITNLDGLNVLNLIGGFL